MPRRERQNRAAASTTCLPVHRHAFIQQLMHKSFMLESTALDSFEQLTGSSSIDELHQMIADQNEAMRDLSFEIKLFKYPLDDQTYVVFINKLPDDPSKIGTHFKDGQKEYLRHVLQKIALDTHAINGIGSASSLELLNMDLSQPAGNQDPEAETVQAALAAAKKLTKHEKEDTLRQLVMDGWLKHHPALSGHYCIGVRSFVELSEMLLESFDLPDATKDAWQNIL